MRDTQPSFFIGLDIGTSAVRCVVGTLDATRDEPIVSVVGHGMAENTGMKKGLVAHVEEVANAINQAVTEAERIAGIRIHEATVNVNGVHVSGLDSKGVIAISAANREITGEDKSRVEEAATIVQIPSNKEIIQVFPKNYRVDGHESIKDPRGMRGVRLEVDAHIVIASTPNLRSLDAVLDKVHIQSMHHTVSGLAAAEAILSRDQKEAGTLVMDIGASTTNLAIIEDGEVQHISVIPMGGINVTNDLAIGLKTELEIAEMVKVKHASLSGQSKKDKVSVQHGSKNHVFDSEEVAMITEARVDEIFEYVEKALKKIHKFQKLPGGIVIVGGTANIPGIAQLAKDKLGLAARVGKVNSSLSGIVDDIQDPSFVTAIGLMELDMIFKEQEVVSYDGNVFSDSFMGFLGNLFNRIKS
mgnify:CR=1 FL=1